MIPVTEVAYVQTIAHHMTARLQKSETHTALVARGEHAQALAFARILQKPHWQLGTHTTTREPRNPTPRPGRQTD